MTTFDFSRAAAAHSLSDNVVLLSQSRRTAQVWRECTHQLQLVLLEHA